ncbi:MAG: pantoate--beta-alanine ligase [Actinomycetota bacterium]|nr:pantoate--beta-alanine ligase [Actinomycetota bacterium]
MTVAVIAEAAELRSVLDGRRAEGQRIGLVTTMGALHAGHLSLVRRAVADCDAVAISVYVNPLQFAPTDDLVAYPRDLETDCARAGDAGADIVFAPSVEQMWPDPPATVVRVEGVSAPLEGRSRPGHFDGVATIVARLFGIVGPCSAYFGEKDYQQLTVIRRMAVDLALPVAVIACPTVRDPDGLALSSRNAYLVAEEREVASHLYWALLAGRRAIEDDRLSEPDAVVSAMAEAVAATPAFTLDYAAVVDPVDLSVPPRLVGEVRLLVAAKLGRARLIDNIAATVPGPS